jgi:hypothetical protein
MGNPPSNPIYLTTDAQSCRLGGTPSTSSTTMSTRPYPCQENGSVYPHPSCLSCIIDDGASSCIMSSSTWKQLGSPTLIPSMTELRAFDGRLCSPLGIFYFFQLLQAYAGCRGAKSVCTQAVMVQGMHIF